MLSQGRITRQISNLYTVTTKSSVYGCRARGKFRNQNLSPLVGDFVLFDEEKTLITEIEPRKNLLSRPAIANVDMALIVTSVRKPALDLTLLDKLISVITFNKIEPVICFTKLDLLSEEELKTVTELKKYYLCCGIDAYFNTEISSLKKKMKDKVVVLAGQTGAGKSSLVNALDSKLELKTQEISEALGRGKHTTRHTEIYTIGGIFLADTPGFSCLDLKDMSKEDLRDSFIEFSNCECKFRDCMHKQEDSSICGVKKEVEEKRILQSRYKNYIQFMEEIKK